jgi:CheY-like chemotaxis protein
MIGCNYREALTLSATLLIAEDDVFIRAMVADFLRDSGFAVVEAANADEAISIFQSGAEIDLLFSDVKMPGSMDGFDLAQRVCAEWPATKILLTSGYHDRYSANNAPAHPVLAKPYQPLAVLGAILAAMEA